MSATFKITSAAITVSLQIHKYRTFGARPSIQTSGEFDTEHLWAFQLPWEIGHDVDGIGTADTNAQTAESATVRRVTVRADQEEAGERVVLEHDLQKS